MFSLDFSFVFYPINVSTESLLLEKVINFFIILVKKVRGTKDNPINVIFSFYNFKKRILPVYIYIRSNKNILRVIHIYRVSTLNIAIIYSNIEKCYMHCIKRSIL